MSQEPTPSDQDLIVLRHLLANIPHGLAALHRLDVQRTQLALTLNATLLLQTAQRLSPLQVKVTTQVLRVVQKPALELARQITETVKRERMLAQGMDPDSPEDQRKFSHQLASSIIISD